MGAAETTSTEVPPRTVTLEDLTVILCGGKELLPTQRKFIFSPGQVKAYLGVLGCAKTTTGCVAGVLLSLCYPGNLGLVGRKVEEDLHDTTEGTFREVVARLPEGAVLDWKPSERRLVLASAVKGGKPSTVLFRPLFDPSKLGSLDLGWFFVDEASEIDERIVHTLVGRLRRRDVQYRTGMLASNPPSMSHWLHRLFVEKVPENWKLFRAGARENSHNLPERYYEDLAAFYPPDFRKRLIDGEWGSTVAGQPVYGDFRESMHVAEVQANPYLTMFRGWDFGYRRPACVWSQLDSLGNLNVLAEELGRDEDLRAFARRVLMRSQLMFPGVDQWEDYCDPAGAQHSDKGQSSVQMLIECGIQPRYRVTKIEEGLTLMRGLISRIQNGRPALQVHPRCKVLVEGFLGGYHYPPEREGKTSAESPWKDGYYDHLQDALRYVIVNIGRLVGESYTQRTNDWARFMAPPRPRNAVTGY